MKKGTQPPPPPPPQTETFNVKDYAVNGIKEQQVLEIKKAFDLFDTDGGGSVDPKELRDSMISLGFDAKAEHIYKMISDLDLDGSGTIDFYQFFQLMTAKPNQNQTREQIHTVFLLFDNERTGYISIKNLRHIAKDLGELDDDNFLQEMIQRADLDQDGLVSEEEFYNVLTKKTFS